MLRVLALLSYLALLLAPLGQAQALPACAMEAGASPHLMVPAFADADDPTPVSTHHGVTEVCKLTCSAVAVLPPLEPDVTRVAIDLPSPRRSASLFASQPQDPSDRPPKRPV